MKKLLSYIVSNFGFEDITDFIYSMVHFKLLFLTLPSSVVMFTFIEEWLGVTSAIFIAFVVLAVVELVTGLWKSRIQNIKWSSRKFSRFGLKILVWLSLIMVANSFVTSYSNLSGLQNWLIFQIFKWLHGVLVVYISFEYLISILENLSKITGQSNNKLISLMQKKFDQFLGLADEITTPSNIKDDENDNDNTPEKPENPSEDI